MTKAAHQFESMKIKCLLASKYMQDQSEEMIHAVLIYAKYIEYIQ